MNPYFRPLSIQEPGGDPTLDPYPVAHAMTSPSRLLVVSLMLGAVSLLSALAFLVPLTAPKTVAVAQLRLPVGARELIFSLREDPAPGSPGGGSGADRPAPGKGAGQGTTPAAKVSFSMMTPTVADLPELAPSGRAAEGMDPGLPEQAGDGIPFGEGTGKGGGVFSRGKAAPGSARAPFDHRFVPRHAPIAHYELKPGEKGNGSVVIALVTVEEDGRVSKVRILSGPLFLHAAVLAAARQWVFEPLAAHGYTGPQESTIRFFCQITEAASPRRR